MAYHNVASRNAYLQVCVCVEPSCKGHGALNRPPKLDEVGLPEREGAWQDVEMCQGYVQR